MKSEKEPTHSAEYVRSISEQAYRLLLAHSAGGSSSEWRAGEADRMIAKDNEKGLDGPKRFSERAGEYDQLTRAYLKILGVKPL